MYMCVCVCARVHGHTYVHLCVHMHVCVCVREVEEKCCPFIPQNAIGKSNIMAKGAETVYSPEEEHLKIHQRDISSPRKHLYTSSWRQE